MIAALLLAAAAARAGTLEDARVMLRRGSWNERLHAVHSLEPLGAPALPALREAAQDGDWQVRMTAVHVMGRAGPEAVPELARVLSREPCRHVRLTAVHWLGSLGAEDALRAALSDESGMARLQARYWLGKKGGEPPPGEPGDAAAARREDLKHCASSPAPGRAAWAAAQAPAAPEEIDEPVLTPDPPEPRASSAAIAAASAPSPAPAPRPEARERERLQELDSLLAERPAPETPAADFARADARPLPAWTLSAPKPAPAAPEALPPGAPGIGERPAPETPPAAVMPDAGAARAPRDPVPALIGLLESQDPAQRARAADELGKWGSDAAPALDALVSALKDEDRRVRASAALAIGNVGKKADRAVPALVKALKRGPEEVELSAALALGRIGTPAARRAFARHSRQSAGAMIRRRAR